ncbi:MAG: DinB family protein [Phycisphaeraceae bacterium]|nr:DinB family protein [Phycisphaeraceae bacterium]
MSTAIIDRYESQAGSLHAWIDGLSAADLDAHPIAGTWSMRELVIHMLDSDLAYGHRMRKLAAEKKPLIMGYDETLWSANAALQAGDLKVVASIFELHRRWVAAFLRALPANAWTREGIHSERGIVTIEKLVRTMTEHVPHHATFVAAKREKLGKPLREAVGAF